MVVEPPPAVGQGLRRPEARRPRLTLGRPRARRGEAPRSEGRSPWPTADPSRGYREELEHFAFCVRNGDASNYHDDPDHKPRCRGEVALADAVIALASNIAMRQKRRIEFDSRWFDWQSPQTPEGAARIAQRSSSSRRGVRDPAGIADARPIKALC